MENTFATSAFSHYIDFYDYKDCGSVMRFMFCLMFYSVTRVCVLCVDVSILIYVMYMSSSGLFCVSVQVSFVQSVEGGVLCFVPFIVLLCLQN